MNETVLITGASSGIGLELAKCFAAGGCRLVLVARTEAALEKLAGELRQKNNIDAIVLPADLSLSESPKQIFEKLSARQIAVDVVVNNAGFGLHGAFAELPLPRQLEILQVNMTALVELTGLFLPAMIQRNRGGILNVGSVAGFQAGPGMAIYYATKAFVLSFTEALAEELSETHLKISVLCPGATETNFSKVARGGKTRNIQVSKMSAEAVARQGHRDFRKGKTISVTGRQNKMFVFLNRLLPRSIPRRIIKFYNRTD